MSAEVIVAVATLVTALGAVIVAWRAAGRAKEAKDAADSNRLEIVATKDGVFEIGKRIDGRLTQLLKTTEELARAQGELVGRAAQKTENDTRRSAEGKT
jgi:hypothetical protein